MKKDTRKICLLRYAAAFTAAMFTATGIGCIITWSSPALDYLKSDESQLKLTDGETSWITPLLPVGSMLGYLMAPFLNSLMKPKWVLLALSIPQIFSWILIITAKNALVIYAARILGGVGYASGLCSLTIYLSEISSQETRGIFLAFVKLFQSVGIFFTLLLNVYFHYYYMNIIILGTMCFFVFVFLFMPDSSFFNQQEQEKDKEMVVLNGPALWGSTRKDFVIEDIEVMEELLKIKDGNVKESMNMKKNGLNMKNGTKAVDGKEVVNIKDEFYKNETCKLTQDFKLKNEFKEDDMHKMKQNIENEKVKEDPCKKFSKIEESIKFKDATLGKDRNFKEEMRLKENKEFIISGLKSSNLWKLFSVPEYRKALIIVVTCAAQEHFSGYSVVRVFTQQIFSHHKTFMSPENSSLLLATLKLTSSIICIQVVERFRRKTLLLFTGLLATLGLLITGLFFFLKSCNVEVSSFGWLPLFGIILYDFNVSIGITNFIYIYLGELFVKEIKSVAITVCKMIYLCFIFINILLYQTLEKTFGIYVVFWLYAINFIVLGLVILRITPETKGKSLDEIQLLLKNKKWF